MKRKIKSWLYISIFAGLVLILPNGCKKDDTNNNTPAPTSTAPTQVLVIGQNYQGGIIAYIFQSGDHGYIAGETHGLIAAPSDQSSGIQWSDGSSAAVGTTPQSLGAGQTNTNTIVSTQGNGNYAAKLCSDLVLGGYSDWYLPSIYELMMMFENKAAIGGFSSNKYWSSCEFCILNAYYFNFADSSASSGADSKTNAFNVRAVRYF